MVVMGCSRRGCDNIMRNTYASSVGQVCYYCKSEFCEYFKDKYEINQSRRVTLNELKIFMDTEKLNESDGEIISVYDLFREDED